MMNAIGSVINQIDSLVWGWWMIILLLGTHIFMTIRTGVIQRKIVPPFACLSPKIPMRKVKSASLAP